jgi:GntR family transcriptional regulator/MocR family aminotransferase
VVRRSHEGPLAGLGIDHSSPTPLFRQLYLGVRGAILANLIQPGERLPSTRILAGQLGVARNTAITAYDQLLAEGYLQSRVGAGTVVARDLPIDEPIAVATRDTMHPVRERSHGMTAHATAAAALASAVPLRRTSTFEIDTPAHDAFAFETMRRLLSSRIRRDFRGMFDTVDPAGILPLREGIAEWAWSTRGIPCTPEQVVVTSGGQHAMELVVRALVRSGDPVAVEDPGEFYVRTLLKGAGAAVTGIPIDDAGMQVELLEQGTAGARLIHVTPSNQYPVGGTMPMARRIALMNWASRTGAVVVEDDCDSEFRYSNRPLAALKGLDAEGSVIYVGTFSRILLPSLRLGYLILPTSLVAPVLAMRALGDRHPPPLEQWLAADFIGKGHFLTHVRRMRKLYAYRQQSLVALLQEHLAQWLDIRPAGAGMNIVGWLPPAADDVAVAAKANAAGLMVRPMSLYFHSRPARPGLLIGHSGVTSGQLRRGIQSLGRVLDQSLGSSGVRAAEAAGARSG